MRRPLDVDLHRNDENDEVEVLHLIGDLDLQSAPELRGWSSELLAEPADGGERATVVVVDLTDVPFVDSTGVGALLSVRREVRARGGELVLAGPSPELRHLLGSLGLPAVLRVYDTRDDAVAHLRQPDVSS
ncbi:anti-sigma B factor antagonist [Quadrisphaera granulorum]|uniref:Anti-sigma factor antagonist n=1 Tax=Quadrisphaera granulorum TaxID=317664 RepID=A0A316A351_9ACTN|nr:STAS domain-containing protein [Quadrisphaera granulorum]PWJ51134.1 anti-sigma B factor antagonist [Quadrisphaera granulorum]SZE97784.1 anti-sigma B factor antagonist [Quadrisphaera granulorum]